MRFAVLCVTLLVHFANGKDDYRNSKVSRSSDTADKSDRLHSPGLLQQSKSYLPKRNQKSYVGKYDYFREKDPDAFPKKPKDSKYYKLQEEFYPENDRDAEIARRFLSPLLAGSLRAHSDYRSGRRRKSPSRRTAVAEESYNGRHYKAVVEPISETGTNIFLITRNRNKMKAPITITLTIMDEEQELQYGIGNGNSHVRTVAYADKDADSSGKQRNANEKTAAATSTSKMPRYSGVSTHVFDSLVDSVESILPRSTILSLGSSDSYLDDTYYRPYTRSYGYPHYGYRRARPVVGVFRNDGDSTAYRLIP